MSSTLINVSMQLSAYIGLSIIIFGIFGNLLNIIVFLSLEIFRKSSSSIYLTVMSSVNIGQLLTGYLFRTLTSGSLVQQIQASTLFCTIRSYIVQIFALTSMSCICLATIDQYLSTSSSAKYRRLSNTHLSYLLSIIIIIFWSIICIPHVLYYNPVMSSTTNASICVVTNSDFQIYVTKIYTPFILDIIPCLIMIIFGLLAYRNVKHISYRTVPLVRRQHEIQITTMVLLQAFISVFLITPYFMFFTITSNIYIPNNAITNAQIQLSSTVLISIYYLYYMVPFYIYICLSERFRQQFYYVIFNIHLKRWKKMTNKIEVVTPQVPQSTSAIQEN